MSESGMRILQVAHGFPPDQMAGAEVYTWTLAREMARRGHAVHVLAPAVRPGHPQHALVEEQVDGVAVLRLNQSHLDLHRLESTYSDPRIDAVFAQLLERLRPDVVHVQHTIGLSIGILGVARAAGVPLVMTLHDYWFHCPRGQRLTPRGHLCTEVQPWRCALCIGAKRAAYGRTWLGAYARGESREVAGEGALLRGLLLAPRLGGYVAREAFRAPILRRLETMRAALAGADRLLAPSQFLLERYVEQGIPREKLELSEYGMDDAPFRALGPRPPRDPAARPLRFGFVGTLRASKGPDLLLRAFEQLPRGGATLELYGSGAGPRGEHYVQRLRSLTSHPGVAFRGSFDNRRIAEVLRGLDVLVVPSRWWENAPLTIHEGVMAEMPVVTSGHGGMAELAERFGNALLFRPDDAEDLARVLRRFLDEPGLSAQLVPRRAVRTVGDDVDAQLERYAALATRASR
jgi:glycosyltransferase involved in cell wall biosynthesis